MTQVQTLIKELSKIEKGETETVFDTVYEKVRKIVFMSLLDDSINILEYENRDDAMKQLKDYSTIKLHGINAPFIDVVNKVLGNAKKVKAAYIDLNFNHYDLYIIMSENDTIYHPYKDKTCDALFVSSNDKIRDDEAQITTSFIILPNTNNNFKDENRFHIISHELCHLVLRYLKDKDMLSKEFIDNCDEDMEEFLCDFLPFYHLRERDYLCNFLDYSKKWFKDDINEKYKQYVKEIVVYMNSNIC